MYFATQIGVARRAKKQPPSLSPSVDSHPQQPSGLTVIRSTSGCRCSAHAFAADIRTWCSGAASLPFRLSCESFYEKVTKLRPVKQLDMIV